MLTYQQKYKQAKQLKLRKRDDKIGATGLLVALLLVLTTGAFNDANALEFKKHAPINDGTDTEINWEGERVEK